MSDVLKRAADERLNSPIVWPNSGSRKKHRRHKLKENREPSKLSLKYNSQPKSEEKMKYKRRSSVDVFERVYNKFLEDEVVPDTPSPSHHKISSEKTSARLSLSSFRSKQCNRVLVYGSSDSSFGTPVQQSLRRSGRTSSLGSFRSVDKCQMQDVEVVKISDSDPEDDIPLDGAGALDGVKEKTPEKKESMCSTEVCLPRLSDNTKSSRSEVSVGDIGLHLLSISKRKTVRISKQVILSSSDDDIPLPLSQRVPLVTKVQVTQSEKSVSTESDDSDEDFGKITRRVKTTGMTPYVISSDSDSEESSMEDISNDKGTGIAKKFLLPHKNKEPQIPNTVPRMKPSSKRHDFTSTTPMTNIPLTDVLEGQEANKFLNSLNPLCEQRHPVAETYCCSFKKKKDELVATLYSIFNKSIFENKLPADMKVTWNPRMTKTAGYCYYRRDSTATEGRSARLELSLKVLDSADRVRDTLIHEMCHAASWIVYGYRDGHGPLWKYWAKKANVTFPSLPMISRCHSYAINTKFTYKCQGCGGCIGRHTKSVDITRKVCSRCGSRFKLLINGRSASEITPKTITPFARFVKENYGKVKGGNKAMKHAEVMKALSAEFSAKAVVKS